MRDLSPRELGYLTDVVKFTKQVDFSLKGTFIAKCYDKDGNLKWEETTENLIVNEGLNAILDIMLHGSTQITTWYVTIFESDTTPGSTDTYAVPAYTECTTGYDETARPEYVEAAASGQSITNSANKAVFTMNATKTIYGASLVGGGTGTTVKGATTDGGTLLASSKFASGKSVVDDDVLNVTYTINASST